MRLILEGNPEEIAALVTPIQERRNGVAGGTKELNSSSPLNAIQEAFRSAIDGIERESC